MSEKKKNRFLDWVNADTDLPTLDELNAEHAHEEHDAHENETTDGEEAPAAAPSDVKEPPAEHPPAETPPKKAKGEALEPIIVDEALQYPDPVSGDTEEPEPAVAPISAPQPKAQRPMITRDQKKKLNTARVAYGVFAVLFAAVIIITLLFAVVELPPFGSPENPAVNEVYHRYIVEGREDTGAVNAVASMILDYRAFDTLGESLMLFTAVMGVVMLIRNPKRYADEKPGKEEEA